MTLSIHEKRIFLVGGLPRSGSTLLMNILGQNPKYHVTASSGIARLLSSIRVHWKKDDAFMAMPHEKKEEIQLNVMRGMLYGWFHHAEQSICFDKYHLWTEHLETAAAIMGSREKVRLLVPVRDLRDVIASFELLHRKTTALSLTHQEQNSPIDFNTAIGRISIFIDKAQPVGRAFNAIRDAVTRGWRANMHFVEFEHLTKKPKQTLEEIYDFLGEEYFQHNFQQIKQITVEDDAPYGFKGLHTIREKIEPVPPRWPSVFDRVVTSEPVWKDLERVAQFWKAYLPATSNLT